MFKIIGGDGRQYGPATVEQVREWIAAGRANARTQIQREGESDWKPLSDFSEFSDALAAKPLAQLPPPEPPPASSAPDPTALANEVLARDFEVNIGSCIERAWDLFLADFWPILSVSALINICGVLLFFVGFFFTWPLTVLAITFLYEDLFGSAKPAAA
jgi:hypothetical protein